jgi:hypothetical protein
LSWHGLNEWQQWVLGVGASLIAALMGWLWKKLWKSPKQQPENTRMHRTASPTIAQHFQPTINIHAAEPPQKKDLLKTGNPIVFPRFEFKGTREKQVFISPYARRGITDPHDDEETEKSVQALVLRFENVSRDGIAKRAMDVVAKMSFRSANGVTEQAVDYGIWLNSPCNCTDMEVGDTRELVLICVMDGKLFSFDDRRELNHDFQSPWSWLDDNRIVDGLENVEVRLIDRRVGATQTFKFRIWRTGIRLYSSEQRS